jgi:hypothetical protein
MLCLRVFSFQFHSTRYTSNNCQNCDAKLAFHLTLDFFIFSMSRLLLLMSEIVKFYFIAFEPMKSHSGIDDDNSSRKTKATAAIPMAGEIIVAAALLLGLLTPINNSYHQPAMAQLQNFTGMNGTGTGGGTTTTSAGHSACIPTQTGGAVGGTNATSSSNTTRSTTDMNITDTTGGEGGGNQSTTSQVRLLIEEACMAAQSNDTLGILMQLNLVLNALEGTGTQGNTNTAISSADLDATTTGGDEEISVDRTSPAGEDDADENAADSNVRDNSDSTSSSISSTDANTPATDTTEGDSECGGMTVGGTSAADDYGCGDPDAE